MANVCAICDTVLPSMQMDMSGCQSSLLIRQRNCGYVSLHFCLLINGAAASTAGSRQRDLHPTNRCRGAGNHIVMIEFNADRLADRVIAWDAKTRISTE